MNYAGKFDANFFFGQEAARPAHEHFNSHSVFAHATHVPLGAAIVPDANFLFNADFKRSGVDLILSKDDREFVVHEYFKGDKRAALSSPDGAFLTGDVVNALTGNVQYSQADGTASVAKVIGHVTKLAGNATAIRNGVSIILNMGDNVEKGDVVQCGSNSTLAITFIDSTVFGLSSNARMVLSEMVYDPNGSNNSSLLSLVQGTISFVAGETAKHGDMKIDTPVATMGVRGTAVLVEIDFVTTGQGTAPDAKFQVLVEPDGTTGSYILFDKNTLQPLATVSHAGVQISINGQGNVSSNPAAPLSPEIQNLISEVFTQKFSDITRTIQNANSSGVPPEALSAIKLTSGDTVIPVLQVIKFVDTGQTSNTSGALSSRDHIPGPPQVTLLDASGQLATAFSIIERANTTGSSAADTALGRVNFLDINPGDRPTAKASFVSFTYQDAQHQDVTATLSALQKAAVAATEVNLAIAPDPSNTNFGSATWTYSIADGGVDFLAAGETLTLTYMLRVDTNFNLDNETTLVPFTITITGTNDAPTASATSSSVTQLIGAGNQITDHAGGTISFADVDLTDRPAVTASFSSYVFKAADGVTNLTLTAAQAQAIEATLKLTPSAANANNGVVTWSYDVDASQFNFLVPGEKLTLIYMATVNDGHGGVVTTPVNVEISLAVNHVPTIAVTSGGFNELPGTTDNGTPDHAGGTITFTDADLTDRPVASTQFTSFTYQNAQHQDVTSTLTAEQKAAIAAVEAALTLTPSPGNTNDGSVTWSYDVADKQFDFLAAGETLTLTYTATVDDGHGGVVSAPLTVAITGAEDVPTIAVTSGGFSELPDTTNSGTPDHAGGTITFADVDLTDRPVASTQFTSFTFENAQHQDVTSTLTAEQKTAIAAVEAALTLTPSPGNTNDGSVTWSYDVADKQFDFLAAGETLTLTYTATIDDGHGGVVSAPLTVTITGANDIPQIVAETDPSTQTVILARSPIILAEGINTNSLGLPTETFDTQESDPASEGEHDNDTFFSAVLGATFTASGFAGVLHGSSGVSGAPFVGPLPGHADTTNYLSIPALGKETITFNSQQNAFGLYWGSVDSYNSISFYDGTKLVASYTGADVLPLLASGNQGSFTSNGYVEFSDLAPFNKVVLQSAANSFEVDNISAGFVSDSHIQLASPITGTLTVNDADIGDMLTASVTGNAVVTYNGSPALPSNVNVAALIDPSAVTFDSVQTNGGSSVLHWTYNPTNADLDFLEPGDTLKITFNAQVNDGHVTTGNQALTVTIVGTGASVVNGTSQNDMFANVGGGVTIFGNGGQDTFAFNKGFGSATIADFDVNNDTIEINHALFASVSAILASAQAANSGHDTVIMDSAHDQITLSGVTVAQVQTHPNDFHLI